MDYSLYLLDEKPTHIQEVAFMLTQETGLHKIDAIRQVRHCHGCLHPNLTETQANNLKEKLLKLGIHSFIVLNEEQFQFLRPRYLKQLTLSLEGFTSENLKSKNSKKQLLWKDLGLISFGILGKTAPVEKIMALPSFQNMTNFSDPDAKKALKAKVVADIFNHEHDKEHETENLSCFIDLIFANPIQFFRISREEFQFHWLDEKERSTSSLINLRTLLTQIIKWSKCSNLTNQTQEFLENPHHPTYFFETEEHLTQYSRWSFQKFNQSSTSQVKSQESEISSLPEPNEIDETDEVDEIKNSKEQKIPLLPTEQEELKLKEPLIAPSEIQAPIQELKEKVSSIQGEEEAPKPTLIYFLLTVISHIICIFILGALMIVSETYLAQLGKPLPKGIPYILRESLEIYYYEFFSPILFYFLSEICFLLNIFPERLRKNYYKTLMTLIFLATIILGLFAMLQIFKA